MRAWAGALLLAVAATGVVLIGSRDETASAQSSGPTMRSFSSERELTAFLRRVQRDNEQLQESYPPVPPPPSPSPPPPLPAASPPPPAGDVAAESAAAPVSITVSGSRAAAPSITNNQTANVDEGGIVKTHGRHLVVLRRGRLFTVDTSNGGLRTVYTVDAFPPSDGGGSYAWYDEMLVSGDLVVVIGFNYARSGTEINRFAISDDGRLTYRDTHHLRSNDYYSSRNYASRLIGTRLVVYTPLNFYDADGEEIWDSLPGLRRWSRGGPEAGFERLATPRRVYVADMLRNSRRANIDTTHSVTSCDLALAELVCRTTVVLGSGSRTFYVAEDAVYVWAGDAFISPWNAERPDLRAMLYRIPLNGSAPQSVGVWGNPTDQFSFRADDDVLNVLVRADQGGDRMWSAEVGEGDLALLRLPYREFGRGDRMARGRVYRPLPGGQDIGSLHNRFIGRHLVYAGSPGWYERRQRRARSIHVVPLAGGAVTSLDSPVDVSRIDVMGRDAMVIGNDQREQLVFQTVDLDGRPRLGSRYALPAAREGENRSHAYFFRSDSPDGADGLLGLPVARAITHPNARFLGSGSGIFFLNRRARELSPAGQLDADEQRAVDDNCLASCTDWYGNARPIFYGDRIFALMGYELVEGRMEQGRIAEVRRIDFTPRRGGRQ